MINKMCSECTNKDICKYETECTTLIGGIDASLPEDTPFKVAVNCIHFRPYSSEPLTKTQQQFDNYMKR